MEVCLPRIPIPVFVRTSIPIPADNAQPKFLKWQRPNPGSVVINCDASFRATNDTGGYGIMIRDCYGRCIAAKAAHFQKVDFIDENVEIEYGILVLMTEMLAILNGLRLAKGLGLMQVHIQSDSNIAISIMQGCNICPQECLALYFDILTEMSFFKWFKFVFVYRECNRAADFLSKFLHSDGEQYYVMSQLPNKLKRIMVEDSFGFVSIRF